MCLQECHLVFLLTKWPFCSSDLSSLPVLCSTLMSWWHPGKLVRSKALRVLARYLRFPGGISHLGECKWSHLQDCAERHVNLGTWILSEERAEHCLLLPMSPGPSESFNDNSTLPLPHCLFMPLLSPLMTFVVKIWKGWTGIQIVHLSFFYVKESTFKLVIRFIQIFKPALLT